MPTAGPRREDLGRVGYSVGVERSSQASLGLQVFRRELEAHEPSLLQADPVLSGQHPTRVDGQADNLLPHF